MKTTVRDRLLAHMPAGEWIELNRLIILAEVWWSDARPEIDRMHLEVIIDARYRGGKIECRRIPA